ncbi:MAG: FtsK/SpoIIIE domain-containing protein [Micropruina sp.]
MSLYSLMPESMADATSLLALKSNRDLLRVAETIEIGTVQVPLLGSSSIWVEDSLAGSASLRLVQAIMHQALVETAPGQLEIIVFDDALSGLAAPFRPLNGGGEKLLYVLHDEQDFKATLRDLRDHVQAVKSLMQGETANLVEYRRKIDYPVEGYKLVVISTDISFLDEATQTQLAMLVKAAPVAGVSFVIHSMTMDANPYVVALCDQLAVQESGIIDRVGEDPIRGWYPPRPPQLIEVSERIANELATTTMPPISFTEVQEVGHQDQRKSENGVSFAIGKYGRETVEITLGDELNQRHNMLVTGAVGQGKSNLIKVIIHSLCQRYSPRELELYLLDLKEGVTLQPFFNEVTGQYLPHARVLGLDADREFGHSVLLQLHDIYRERLRLFKAAKVENIRQYRRISSERTMPRIVVVVDEFQLMFAERDRMSDETAALLVRGVRLFRACGIHIILASQTIGGNASLMGASGEGLFAQVPVRIALKNSVNESRATLGDRNDAAAHLRAREAIVNEDYGDLSANRKTRIAAADEPLLTQLRTRWWEQERGATSPPYVFQGEKARSLATESVRLRELRRRGERSLLLGSRIGVDALPLEVPFGRDVGRNVAVVGSGDAIPAIESMLLSLAFQAPDTRFMLLDLLDRGTTPSAAAQGVADDMSRLGAEVRIIGRDATAGVLTELSCGLTDRHTEDDMIVVGLGLDRCRQMPMEFQDIVKIGPSVGVHVIGWWLKLESFREHVGYGGESSFDVRLALRLDAQSAKQLMADPLLDWRPADNRALAWDSAELPEPLRIIPYTVVDEAVISVLKLGV